MSLYRVRKRNLARLIGDAVGAARRDGAEICGLLVERPYGRRSSVLEPVRLDNKRRRSGGFAFYVGQVRDVRANAAALGHRIVGTFHSHPAYIAKPGDADIAGAPEDSLMLIIDVCERTHALWRIRRGRAERVRMMIL